MIEQLRVAGTVSVHEIRCPGGSSRPAEVVGMAGYELYLARSGCFSYRTAGADLLADPTLCLLGGPSQQADIGHPVPGGDTGTAVLFTAEVVAAVAAGSLDLPPFSPVTPHGRSPTVGSWARGNAVATTATSRSAASPSSSQHLPPSNRSGSPRGHRGRCDVPGFATTRVRRWSPIPRSRASSTSPNS